MNDNQAECLFRAILALTCDEIIRDGEDVTHDVPLLVRSISYELRQIERQLGASGKTNLCAIAASIDEALLALEECLSEEGYSVGR